MRQHYFKKNYYRNESFSEINKVNKFVIDNELWKSCVTLNYFNVKRAMLSNTLPKIHTLPIHLVLKNDNFYNSLLEEINKYYGFQNKNTKIVNKALVKKYGSKSKSSLRLYGYDEEYNSPLIQFKYSRNSFSKDINFITHFSDDLYSEIYKKRIKSLNTFKLTIYKLND